MGISSSGKADGAYVILEAGVSGGGYSITAEQGIDGKPVQDVGKVSTRHLRVWSPKLSPHSFLKTISTLLP